MIHNRQLGVLPNNEQYIDEMVKNISYQYVPVVKDVATDLDIYSPLPFFGDQLTAARALTAKKSRVTSKEKSASRGLVPFCADWHAKVNFIWVGDQVVSI